LTTKGKDIAREDDWRLLGSSSIGQSFAVSVGTLRLAKMISLTPLSARLPWWSNKTDQRRCLTVKYSARFILFKAGYDLMRVNGGNGRPVLGSVEWAFPQPMSAIIDSAPRFADAGKSVIEVANVCDGQKRGWHVVFPPEGSL